MPEPLSPILRLGIGKFGTRQRGPFFRYGLAVGLTALGVVAAKYTAMPGSFPSFFFFPAIIAVVTWFGGRRAGLISVVLSFAGLALFLGSYFSSVPVTYAAIARLAAFVFIAVLVWVVTAVAEGSMQELQRMNLRFGGVVQISEDAIISIDERQHITLFNSGAERIFGFTSKDIMGKPLDLLIPERYRAMHREHLLGFMNSPDVLRPMGERSTIFGLRKDGAEFPAEASISKFQTGKDKILTVRLRDVGEKQIAERGMRELAATVEWSEDAIIRESLDGVITSWNSGAEKIFGYKAEEVIGKHASILVPTGQADEVSQHVAQAAGGEGFRTDSTRLRKDGRSISVSLSVFPIKDKQGRVVAIGTAARDVTDRKRLEEQLRQSQKMEAIGRLAGGIAHDFNNLLSIIVGYTYVLQSSLPDDDMLRSSAEQVMHAAEKASSLTRQLLAFSRRQVMQAEILDMNEILAGMEKLLPRLIGEDVEIRVKRSENLSRVKSDPSQIEQVIMNLVVNARDAMPNGGKLTIETEDVYFDAAAASHHGINMGHYVLLAVTDTGVGMDAETKANIFEPFFTTKEAGRGTGLGLATVYGIVSQSNGFIWVYSELGQGTTFKIYFPATTAAAEPSRISHQPRLSLTGSETILLVEDEEDLRTLIEQVLTDKGYKVVVAANGDEALAVARARRGEIHLLVTDVVMPKMSGRALADSLRLAQPELDILFMSGYTNNSLQHGGSLQPGTWFLQKPFTPDVLLRKVREVLDSKRQRISDRRAM